MQKRLSWLKERVRGGGCKASCRRKIEPLGPIPGHLTLFTGKVREEEEAY
jgi:hypothetical protein